MKRVKHTWVFLHCSYSVDDWLLEQKEEAEMEERSDDQLDYSSNRLLLLYFLFLQKRFIYWTLDLNRIIKRRNDQWCSEGWRCLERIHLRGSEIIWIVTYHNGDCLQWNMNWNGRFPSRRFDISCCNYSTNFDFLIRLNWIFVSNRRERRLNENHM